MIKNLLTILWASFYLLLNVGLSVDAHFCKGSLVDLSIFGKTESCCAVTKTSCCKKAQQTKDCCQEETFNLQLEDWQIAPNDGAFDGEYFNASEPFFHFADPTHGEDETWKHPGEPPPRSLSRRILFQSLTFYG